MTTPVDPNAPVQQAGETAANFAYRLQQYNFASQSGPNQAMSQTWISPIVNNAAPNGFQVL